MKTAIITLAGLLVVMIISNVIFFRLLKKSLKSQSFFHDLYRREQKDCLRIEQEKRLLEKQMQAMTETISNLNQELKKKFNRLGAMNMTGNYALSPYPEVIELDKKIDEVIKSIEEKK